MDFLFFFFLNLFALHSEAQELSYPVANGESAEMIIFSSNCFQTLSVEKKEWLHFSYHHPSSDNFKFLRVRLGRYSLYDFPVNLGIFSNLRDLHLPLNNITNLGTILKDLLLTSLNVSFNQLIMVNGEDLPQTLTNLVLEDNQIEVFSNIASLKNLTSLNLNANKLQKLPFGIRNIPLKILRMNNNALAALYIEDLPPTLEEIALCSNNIGFLVGVFFTDCPFIKRIDLIDNPLEFLSSKDKILIDRGIFQLDLPPNFRSIPGQGLCFSQVFFRK